MGCIVSIPMVWCFGAPEVTIPWDELEPFAR